MQRVESTRIAIYNHFHASKSCQAYFHAPANEEEHVAYYNSMYLLQNSTESLIAHRQSNFSSKPLAAYLEFWGLMQAAIIQQDALKELHFAICGTALNTQNLVAWFELRDLRNFCAGHPAKKSIGSPLTRTFMGRNFGDYTHLSYERWEKGSGTSHPSVALGDLMDRYAAEAADLIALVLAEMKRKWP